MLQHSPKILTSKEKASTPEVPVLKAAAIAEAVRFNTIPVTQCGICLWDQDRPHQI